MKNKFGLLENDMSEIVDVLSQFSSIEKAVLFGSRAKGNFKNGSDIDIAIFGNDLNSDIDYKISYQLNEETNMPYKFDILIFNKIQEAALIDHISRIGIEIYTSNNH
jgi:predicted nucleotidyltransferase